MSQQSSSNTIPFLNRFMSAVLRSPLHGMASRSVMLITFTGRRTGKSYTTPISYARGGDLVTAFTGSNWWRNLAGSAPVTVRIKNKEYHGRADVVSEDKTAVAEGLREFLRVVRTDARFYKVKYDEAGEPIWEDVLRAAQQINMIRIESVRAAEPVGQVA